MPELSPKLACAPPGVSLISPLDGLTSPFFATTRPPKGVPLMTTTPNATVGACYGARLRIESVAPMHAWKQQRPQLVTFAVRGDCTKTDNSTDVSARKRRHL